MNRAERRHRNIKKAIRKQKISKEVYNFNWYDNLHQYSKNKVHCSCPMCKFKNIWEPNARTHSDMMKETGIEQQIKDFNNIRWNGDL